jgi:DNA-binding transcriptional MocR family regulator
MQFAYHYCAVRYRNNDLANRDYQSGISWLGDGCFARADLADASFLELRKQIALKISTESGVPCEQDKIIVLSLTKL